MSTATKLAVAATLLIAAAAIGFALAGSRPPVPITWTYDRIDQDWPAPVRAEPAELGPIVMMRLADDAVWDSSRAIWDTFEYREPIGDVGGKDGAWVDITEVRLAPGTTTGFTLELAAGVTRPQSDPAERWIAFGVVQDANGDGTADVRLGIDNQPAGEHRVWRTDLASGETESQVVSLGYGTSYPGERDSGNRASLDHRLTFEEMVRPFPFYAWASMIEDGRVVATDYAPDVGWLQEGAQPEVTLDGPAWGSESDLTGEGGNHALVQALTITSDGKIAFDTGCNAGDGNVTVEADRLLVTDLVLTRRPCTAEVSVLDAIAMDVLGAPVISYELMRGVLRLWVGENAMHFRADYGP